MLQAVRKEQSAELLKMEEERDKLRVEINEARRDVERKVDDELEREAKAAVWVPLRRRLENFFGVPADKVTAWVDDERRRRLGQPGVSGGASADAERVEAVARLGVPRRAVATRWLRTQWLPVLILIAAVTVALLAVVVADGLSQLLLLVTPLLVAARNLAVVSQRGASYLRLVHQQMVDVRDEVATERRRIEETRQARVDRLVRADDGKLLDKSRQLAEREQAIERQRATVGLTANYLSVAEFVRKRLDEGHYQELLGLMRQVHVDLRDLSESLIVQPHDVNPVAKQESFPRGPARVVLFIDDLDRCPPKRVVEVFEAIQLLLSTRLFVVVVALDVRYVLRALEDVYKGVLERWGEPSGLDYIEKIVQIPYRTRRIDVSGMQRFLDEHLPIHREVEVDSSVVVDTDAGAAGLRSAASATVGVEGEGFVTLAMSFTDDEAAVMHACGEAVGLSPRSVKRLVNVSMLIKLIWARERPARALSPRLRRRVHAARSRRRPRGDDARRAAPPRRVWARPEPGATDRAARNVRAAARGCPTRLPFARWRADVEVLKALRPIEGGDFELGREPLSQLEGIVPVVGSFCFVGEVGEEAARHVGLRRGRPAQTSIRRPVRVGRPESW